MKNIKALELLKSCHRRDFICSECQSGADECKSSCEYGEALDIAIKALEDVEIMKNYVKPCYECKYRPDKFGCDYTCANCYKYDAFEKEEQA